MVSGICSRRRESRRTAASRGAARRARVLAVDGGEPGELLLRSAEELGDYPVTVVHSLREWAGIAPEHPLISERARGDWRTVSYGRAAGAADAIGQALLDRGLGPGRPLLVLSGNGVDHLLVTLGAMTAGIPVAPVSVAYSLQSRDHARIRDIAGLISPGAVFAADAAAFEAALDALPGIPAVVSAGHRDGAEQLSVLMNTNPGEAVRTAFANLSPDGTAKILFTSGSTGAPKGVLNTHRMLAANQQMIRQAWPFLGRERPVIVDWLPWSHTFGGNHNLNMMISSGGTLYVDAGRPVPALFGQTIRNLTDVPPTIYFNVPAGYAQLVPALEADPEFAARFFSRLRLIFNAAAALPAALRDRLAAVAERTVGRQVPVTGSWGATETAPAVTSAHFPFTDARCIGVPLPGAEVKLVPADGDACEIRVRGPMVTPGLLRPAGPDRGGVRRRRLLPDRRRGRARRPRRPLRGAGLPRQDRRGLQARVRHVRPGRRGAHQAAVRDPGALRRGARGGEQGLRLRARLAERGRGQAAARRRASGRRGADRARRTAQAARQGARRA